MRCKMFSCFHNVLHLLVIRCYTSFIYVMSSVPLSVHTECRRVHLPFPSLLRLHRPEARGSEPASTEPPPFALPRTHAPQPPRVPPFPWTRRFSCRWVKLVKTSFPPKNITCISLSSATPRHTLAESTRILSVLPLTTIPMNSLPTHCTFGCCARGPLFHCEERLAGIRSPLCPHNALPYWLAAAKHSFTVLTNMVWEIYRRTKFHLLHFGSTSKVVWFRLVRLD